MQPELPYRPPYDLLVIEYLPADNLYMKSAREVSHTSTDGNIPTGAVIVKNNQIIGRGSNQVPLKNKYLVASHKHWCIRRFFGVPSGKKYWLCPGCASLKMHAEPRAIRNAHQSHQDTSNSDLYLYGQWWCCKSCCDAMITAGIKRVFLLEGSERFFNFKHPDNILGKQR